MNTETLIVKIGVFIIMRSEYSTCDCQLYKIVIINNNIRRNLRDI